MKILKILVIGLVIASTAFISVGFINPTVTYETSVLVNKPVGHSFSVFNNPFNAKKWMPGFVRMSMLEGMPNQVGFQFEMVFEENGEEYVMHETMTGFEQNKLFAFDMNNEFLESKVKITFEDEGGKTRIISTTETRAKNFVIRSLFPFMKSDFQSKNDKTYANLKKLIEAEDYHNNVLMDFFLKQG